MSSFHLFDFGPLYELVIRNQLSIIISINIIN